MCNGRLALIAIFALSLSGCAWEDQQHEIYEQTQHELGVSSSTVVVTPDCLGSACNSYDVDVYPDD